MGRKSPDINFCHPQKLWVCYMLNNNLEQQADALYQEFFSPKSGTQGKIATLDEYCSIFTGKKNANASVDGGQYKFFTCAPDALQIDSYIYDGNAIIVSGNGAYAGRTRFYSGRFDLYQRTYACTLLDNINPDYIFPLYWFVASLGVVAWRFGSGMLVYLGILLFLCWPHRLSLACFVW